SPHKNADFQNIIKILGLRHGEIHENVEKLRYGHLMIMADQGLANILAMKGKMYFGDLDLHIKDFFWVDNEDGDAIELAFSNKKIEERKDWLRAFKVWQYLVSDLQRSIPSMVDGLKPHQRSILFSAFKFPIIQEINVALLVFSHYVSAHSAYYLDEASLVGNIVGMAQSYVGSNNINLLQPKGQYGTRHMGGKDH
nr:DNA topoisomerase 2 [Tanacetum cinerariifolium]